MAKGRIRLLSTVPGPQNLGPIVRDFCRRDGGVVTALSDSAATMLASLIPEDSDGEVLQFGGLARRFASFCGEIPLPIAHDGHVVAAIGAACETISADSPFALTAHRLGLHKAIAETLHEMSEYGLGPDKYEALAPQVDADLGAKLLSLAEIEREAADTLRQLGRGFSREHYRVCQDSAPEKGADLGRVLVLAGGDFSPQAVGLLKWAATQGARITVVIYRHDSEERLFRGARLTAAELGIEVEEAGQANRLMRNLFAQSQDDGPGPKCSIVSTADPLAECEWALRGCLERHRAGIPYERMAIHSRDLTSYGPLAEASAKRLGVPIRMWRRAPLLTNSFARLTAAALDFCASGDVRSLLPLTKATYIKLHSEGRSSLGVALKSAHAARGDQWRVLAAWVSEQGEPFGWLLKLLEWRDQAISSPVAIEVWIGKLRDLMSYLPIEEGTPGGRERDKRAQYVLHQSLNQIASVRRIRQSQSISLSEFGRRAKEIWEEADVSIPALEQGVLVTSNGTSLPELRCLFVLGMLEGVFPRRRTEDPILSDFERQAISELRGGIRLPISRDRAEAERDEFYTVCAAASEEIVFSYPETDEERDNVPAFYLDEVSRAVGGISPVVRSRDSLSPPIAECLANSDRQLKLALDDPSRSEALPLRFANAFTARSFAPDDSDGFSPRELRRALQCPFSSFADRVMNVHSDRLRARWYSLARLPQVADVLRAETPESAHDDLDAALEKQLDGLYSDVPEWEIALLRSGGQRLIREWVAREFASRRIWTKEPGTLRLDVQFGEAGLRDDLPKIARLKGRVAATSRVGQYAVVHLAEASGPTKPAGFSNELSEQDRLYYGLHLLAAYDRRSPATALEIETMSGERVLMLLPRLGGDLTARVQDGLKVVDLGGGEDSGGVGSFYDDVKVLAREAMERLRQVDVRALKGDHCAWCDFGELCRGSMDFGEEDSPFAD